MRRAPDPEDFPLLTFGAAIFATDDPVPIAVLPTMEGARCVAASLNIAHAYQLSGCDPEQTQAVLAEWFAEPAAPDPQLPLPIDEPDAWSLDRGVKARQTP